MATQPQGLFDLQGPRDLLEKLEHDFDRLKNSPRDEFAAFDFFVTARHLPDWLYPDAQENNWKKRADLLRNNPLLRVCAHIADGSKHFQSSHHKSVQGTAVQQGAFDRNIFDPNLFHVDALRIHLEKQEAEAYGSTVSNWRVEFWTTGATTSVRVVLRAVDTLARPKPRSSQFRDDREAGYWTPPAGVSK